MLVPVNVEASSMHIGHALDDIIFCHSKCAADRDMMLCKWCFAEWRLDSCFSYIALEVEETITADLKF